MSFGRRRPSLDSVQLPRPLPCPSGNEVTTSLPRQTPRKTIKEQKRPKTKKRPGKGQSSSSRPRRPSPSPRKQHQRVVTRPEAAAPGPSLRAKGRRRPLRQCLHWDHRPGKSIISPSRRRSPRRGCRAGAPVLRPSTVILPGSRPSATTAEAGLSLQSG